MGAIGTHTLIQKITVGSAGTASVTFSSIPDTYTDLCLKVSARTNYAASVNDGLQIYFNGLTTNLTTKELYGTGSVAGSGTDTINKIGYMTAINATASTFGNGEIYIPNYTSSNYKSSSGDGVSESNVTGAYLAMNANLWSSIAAITSITLKSANSGAQVFQQYSTFYLYGIKTSSVPASPTPQAQGGDIIVNDGTYWYHAFISTGAFVPKRALTADVLVVAGGGAGGENNGGGGGAGGVQYTTSQTFISGTTYTTTVGSGGTGLPASGGASRAGGNGSNSNVTGGSLSLTPAVGGGGGSGYNTVGSSGGSGGGAGQTGYGSGNKSGGSATSGQGFAGGTSIDNVSSSAGAGGGGAGGVGSNNLTNNGGNGGVGTNTYSSWLSATGLGVSGYIAGGGGGCGANTNGSGGSGGATAAVTSNSTAGTPNTGSGSGGSFNNGGGTGNGGSGLIIIRYKL